MGEGYWFLIVKYLERELEGSDFPEWLVFSVMCVISLITCVSSISRTFPSWTLGGGGGLLLGVFLLLF